jgi:hypothetical protein
VHKNVDELDLVDKDALLLCAVNYREILATTQLLQLLLVPQNFHILIQARGERLKKVVVDLAQLLKRKVLQREGTGLDDTIDLVSLHVVGEDLDELKNLCVEALIVNFEMAGSRLKPAFFLVHLHREELLQNMESVLEIGVLHVQSQLDEQVVVLVVR